MCSGYESLSRAGVVPLPEVREVGEAALVGKLSTGACAARANNGTGACTNSGASASGSIVATTEVEEEIRDMQLRWGVADAVAMVTYEVQDGSRR